MNDLLKHKLAQLPTTPGCYIFRGAEGQALYVGKAQSLRPRVRSYFQQSANHSPRTEMMVSRIQDMETILTDSPVEALLLESNLIKRLKPHYNIRLRDDKHYPYICLTLGEPFPRAIVTRRARRDGNRYFGPYTNSGAMRQTLRLIKQIFHLRGCSRDIEEGDEQRVCLDYHLKLCPAPCASLITCADYTKLVDAVSDFLRGKADDVLARLRADMERAAANLQFEQAARIRDQLQAIARVVERQKVLSTDLQDQDVIALVSDGFQTCAQVFIVREGRLVGQQVVFLDGAHPDELPEAMRQFVQQFYQTERDLPRQLLVSHELEDADVTAAWLSAKRGARVGIRCPQRGEKKRLVEMAAANARQNMKDRHARLAGDQAKAEEAMLELQEALGLNAPPYRIECYDISNTQGQESVGVMVVFEGGQPKKSDYRKFKIKTVDGPNDFASMREVLSRRLKRSIDGDQRFGELPDLIVIDGGKGQLSAALQAEDELAVEIPTVGLAKRLEEVFLPGRSDSILLPRRSQGLFLLQRVRDEAHRFGIAYHRTLRGKRQTRSQLDSVPGIGDKRRRALMRRFGSVSALKQATVADLVAVKGMTRSAAEAVHRRLRAG